MELWEVLDGQSDFLIDTCLNTGNIKSTSKLNAYSARRGGILGMFMGAYEFDINTNIKSCYNIGSVTGSYGDSGGIVGLNGENTAGYGVTISNCYNAGSITGTSGVGALVGQGYYFKVNSCVVFGNITTFVGIRNGTVNLDKVYLSSNLTKEVILSVLGNQFSDDSTEVNNGYPILLWQIQNKYNL